jgi:hypothetical protein
MALIFCDGFDTYASGAGDPTLKWDATASPGPIEFTSPGRFGYGQYVTLDGDNVWCGFIKNFTAGTVFVMGCAINLPSGPEGPIGIMSLWDGAGQGTSNMLGGLGWALDGSIGWYIGANYETSLGTLVVKSASAAVPTATWVYVEVAVTLSESSGSVAINVNGSQVASISGVQTAETSSEAAQVWAGVGSGGEAPGSIDDFYILNGSSPNNTMFGPVGIVPLVPTGNGRINDFTPIGQAHNWQNVSQFPPNSSDYNQDDSVNDEDCYTITPLSNFDVSNVFAVQACALAQLSTSGSRVLSAGVGNGSTEAFDSGTALPSSYHMVLRPMDENPLTSAAWEVADFTALQSAVKVIS